MKIYLVGGAVRDNILGIESKDKDYVVVNSSPQEMKKKGFISVGNDFPVFLHPKTKFEYALARTEKKVGHGYTGFKSYSDPNVTLLEDLERRDLTINAMARDISGNIIDPFGGINDLNAKIIRHVSPAFIEDPLRVLRVARFAAKFKFSIAKETKILLKKIVQSGELAHLVSERIWQELAKGIMEKYPSEMLKTLIDCGAFFFLFGKIEGTHLKQFTHNTYKNLFSSVDYAAVLGHPLHSRFAILMQKIWNENQSREKQLKWVKVFFKAIRAPSNCERFTILTLTHQAQISKAYSLNWEELIQLIESADGIRRPDRFEELLSTCKILYLFSDIRQDQPCSQEYLLKVLSVIRNVDLKKVIAGTTAHKKIQKAIKEARIKALQDNL